jgi:hypothetical protein
MAMLAGVSCNAVVGIDDAQRVDAGAVTDALN